MPDNVMALSRRFLGLSTDKRRVFLSKLQEQGLALSALPIPSGVAGEVSPASYAQQRLWFIDQLEPGNSAYHLPGAIRLTGKLDHAALRTAFDTLARRHHSLRTTFKADDNGEPQQVVNPVSPVEILQLTADSEEAFEARAGEVARQPFDLASGPLWRVVLVRMAEDDHRLVLCLHHIIADGWSIQVMLMEFAQCYRAALAGEVSDLPPLPLQYADVALWQRRALEAGAGEADLAYWTRQLGDEPQVLELPTDRPRPAQQTFRGGRHHFTLDDGLAEALNTLARSQGTTFFTVMLAAYKVLLHRLSGQSDLSVGVPIAGRERTELEGLIGFFVNTQILRSTLDGSEAYTAVLYRERAVAQEAQAHQALPFEHLVDHLQPERSLSHNPLFQVLYNHQQRDGERFELVSGLTAELLPQDAGAAQFDLALHTWAFPDGRVGGNWNYATDLFDEASVAHLHQRFERLLQQIVAAPEAAIADYDLLDADDRMRLADWNATAVDYGQPQPVHRLFEEQAAAHPGREAIVFGDQRLSYAEVNQAANRLAHALIGQGVNGNSLVGVAAERSIAMVVALYAIQKAGAAYVPIDPDHPEARQQQVLADAGIDLLLTHDAVIDRLRELSGLTVLNLDQLDLSGQPISAPTVEIHPEQRAYVIYTSGSTGKPKGVANTHAALYNRLQWMQAAYGLGEGDTVLQKTPYSFDVSVWEFFWPLMVGARLVVAQPGDHKDPAKLIGLIQREAVTTVHFVPSMLSAFLMQDDLTGCESLRRIVCSGEALPKDLQDEALRRLPQANVYNLYGPTEAAIDVTHWTCGADERTTVPIGRPIANLQIHILDERLNPQPIGVPGELYIGGAGLAQGYHGRRDLTAERFVPNPFGQGDRLYRSGDLARWCADGTLEYLGRLDHQIKLRGLRIELGEIEAALRDAAHVTDAVVIARNEQLIGYVLGTGIDNDAVKAELKHHLPDYMVPAHIMALDSFPLSANGKLDRKALPDPDIDTAEYKAPQGEVEQALADLWHEVLGVEQVGRDDNFFSLGGDSILSLRIIAKGKTRGIALTPRDLFERQTVAELAQAARPIKTATVHAIEPDRAFPLTPIQQWFFDQAMPQPSHWNQSLLLKPQTPLQPDALAQALNALINHHDALRLSFTLDRENRLQRYRPETSEHDVLWVRDSDVAALKAVCEEAQASLDIAEGPLLRAVLIRLDNGEERLLLAIHHLAVDGVSWRILLDDLMRAYQQAANGEAPELGDKTTAFQTWADELNEVDFDREHGYWSAIPQPQPLPGMQADGANTVAHRAEQRFQLDSERTQQLLEQAPAAFRTQINDLLLTALGQALRQWTGQSSPVIALESHGREDLFDGVDLSRTVGWFTSLYPVQLPVGDDLVASLKATKETLRAVPHGGIGYGVLRYLRGATDLPDLSSAVLFNYLGQVGGDAGAGFTLASESPGNARASDAPLCFELSLDSQVRDDQLEMVCSYSAERHNAEAIETLMSYFQQALDAVLAVCREQSGLTPSDVPLVDIDQAVLDALPLAPMAIDDVLPLTPMQQGLLFHSELGGSTDLYVNQVSVTIDDLPLDVFKQAWVDAVSRHPILRAAFIHAPGNQAPLQVIHRSATLAIRELDRRGDTSLDLGALCEQEKTAPFDLAQPPLMRLVLVRMDERRWHMVWTLHHILLDGWSSAALLSEVMEQVLGGQPQTAARYRDYFHWLAGRDTAQTKVFWRQQLQTVSEPTRLAPLLAEAAKTDEAGDASGEIVMALDHQRLGAFAREQQVTLNTLIQAAWALLLQRYTGQRQVAFGATVAGRPTGVPGMERQLGLFINTLPVVQAPAPEQQVGDWLAELQAHNLALREHEHTPLYQIQQLAGQAGRELFDTLLVFENFPVDEALRGGGAAGGNDSRLCFSDLRISERTHYPLSLAVEAGQDLVLHLHYQKEQVSERRAQALSEHLQQLLTASVQSARQSIGDLPLLTDAEQEVWDKWNQPDYSPVDLRPICAQIADRAVERPEAIAVVHGQDRLTFAEFDARANRLAHWLIGQGVGAESRVGVALERGVAMLVALYAVHKTGAAYVPLDPDYPAERVRYMLEDSGAALLLSHDAALDRLPVVEGIEAVNLDHLNLDDQPSTVPDAFIHPEQLAYLIYTSGSTGKPKGVAVPHGALSMHCQTIGERYGLTLDDRELHFLSISFDGAHERWLTALSHGARIVLRDQALWSVQQTYDCLIEEGITVAAFPPSYLRQLAEWAELKGQPPGVRIYCFAGEAFSRQMMHHAIDHLKPDWVINGYGPTETVVTPTLWRVPAKMADFASPYAPIGELVGDRQGYVLDNDLNLLPPNVAGELYLGGALARGYLDRPGTTAERFVPNPFRPGERLYRTGDRVKLNPDGQLEYLGRMDQQVKLRGFRIEIGEVEAALKACAGVKDTLAVVKDTPAGQRLVGYVSGEELDERTIKARLKEQLPEYMVPSHIVTLERLPQLPNGKLDRNALPEPAVGQTDYEAPATTSEHRLAAIWQDLLHRDRIGRHDHFLELGGHSLLATQLVSRIRHEQGVELPLRAIFEAPQLTDLATWLDDLDGQADSQGIRRLGLEQAPQSFAQQRLWFLDQLEPASTAYNLPGVARLTGDLDEQALRQAFDGLTARHEVLRTRLVGASEGSDTPQQIVDQPKPVTIERVDLSKSADSEAAFRAHALAFMARPFSLADGPLWRVGLVALGDDEWRLLLCMHHGISDGWSVTILLRDFAALYQAACYGRAPALDALPIQYADFAVWQREWLAGGEGERQLEYWRRQLGDDHPVLELPTDRPRPARQSFRGARHHFTFETPLAEQLRKLAATHDATPFMVLLAAYSVLLHRLSGQDDVRVGVPVAGRNRQETEDLIGFFVNTQVLRCPMDSTMTFEQVLDAVRNTAIDAQAHQDLPFEQLVEALQPERSLSHNPLFQVAYDHQRRDHTSLAELPGLEVDVLELNDGNAQFDLALNTLEDADGELSGNWNYATDLFDAASLEHLHERFEQLLAQVVMTPEQVIGEYNLLDASDRKQLADWNATAVDYGQPQPVHRLFERQAEAHPDREALVFGDQRLSYAELDQSANRLAHALIGQGVNGNSLVGVAAERSTAMVVALYAIQKAGAAYVPIDPDHPEARQQQVLKDAGIDLLLTHNAVIERLPELGDLTVLNLDQLDLSGQPISAPTVEIHPEQRAYVIYTSGSTGKPKGVANTHSALFNRLQWMQAAYELGEGDTVLQKTPYSFDVSVWEFFWPLMVGARLVVAQPGDHKDPSKLVDLIRREAVTTVHFVPSMLSAFLLQDDFAGCESLRRIVCSGEALPKDLQDEALRRLPHANLYNLYGPTEAAIDVTHWTCGADERTTVPIGRPIANLQIYILDERLNPQPIGVPGELYIGGAGLARGYHGRPDLTAERFVPNPFAKGERLYRSGDLARWCADGTLEYLGRLDHQIKLRGLRIELGEIEAALRDAAHVTDAVVIARNEQLIGYVLGTGIDNDAVKAELKRHLPDYMVPAHIMVLDSFPLSANGKLDRKALPDPDIDTAEYQAPHGEVEQALADLWQEVLGVEQVGRDDNFFSLGGHSLLGVHLVHRIQKTLNRTLPLSALFESASLAELASTLATEPESQMTALQPYDRGQLAPQSFAQQRLWFLAQLEPESSAYHLPGGLHMQGRLDEHALVSAFEQLAQRHESLRTCFRHGDDGVPHQWVLAASAVRIERHDLSDDAQAETAFDALFREFSRRPFDLENAPPWRVALVQMDASNWRLLLCMHHIISDGWSMQLLLEELVGFYRRDPRGESSSLEPLPVQYADYALWQREHLSCAELDRQLAWWKEQLGDEHPTLDLPTDRPRPAQRDGRGARHAFTLSPVLVEQLRKAASEQRVSLFMVILAGFEALLYRLSGQHDLRVGIPVSGRHQPGTDGLIGFFVNTLVVRAEIEPGDRVGDLIAQVRERMHGAQAHADLPFERLVEALQPERSLSHNPLFQVSYNHQVFDEQPLSTMDALSCEPLACPAENAHFDLVLGTQEQADGRIDGYLDFATDIFDAATVECMAEQLQAMLDVISREPEKHLGELPLLTADEEAIWTAWNQPEYSPVDPRPICALIADQAVDRPEAIAVVHGQDRLTFAAFDARANRLAHWLIGQGVGAESRVGVALERGVDMLVALYAVHKTGAAYVPLDPDYPAERVRYMLEDSGAALLLSHDAALDRLPAVEGVETINLNHLELADQPSTVPDAFIHPEQLAYLIYTSGSTGKPKGVAVPHGAMSMHCQTIGERYGLTPEDRELHFLSISFDGAHERWLTALSHGTRIVLRDQALWSVQQTYDCLIEEGITVAAFPPSYLRQLAEWAELKGQPPGVRIYCFAGEAFSRQMMHHVIDHLKPDWVINGYGPTETVVTPALWRVPANTADFASPYAPIGDLVGDRQGYVLDSDLNLLPPNVAGELYLGGALARGYLDRPGTTAERFVPNPFRPGERLYRTGDRVKLNPDGQLEYLGRMDQQVKLRGFRIEIGEVEAALKACAGVKDTLAVVKETAAGQRLVGYVSGEELDEHSIKARLKEQLPEYMVPSHIVTLERLPQLPNGKLDRNALPEPVSATQQSEAPHGEREILLAALWQGVLGVDQVSRGDSFFELGGDSIQSLGLITRLRQSGWQLTPKTVFLKPVLSEMAAALEPVAERLGGAAEKAHGTLPLTPIQAHFFEQPMRDPSHWNQSLLLAVKRPLETDYLLRAVEALIAHHDSLRLGFRRVEGRWQSFYREHESADRLLKAITLQSADEVTAVCDTVQRGFDLEHGPLAGLLLVNLPDNEQRLLLSFHHLIVDGVSWRILLEDLTRAYQQIETGLKPDMGTESVSYQQWAHHLTEASASGQWDSELDYWARMGEGAEAWPVDNPDGRNANIDATHCEWHLPADQTRRLLRETLAARNVGIDDLLLTALAEGLRAWGGLREPVIAIEGHGREPLDETLDLSRTLGWFTSLYPLRLRAAGDPETTLDAIRAIRAEVPGKGIGFGALRYLAMPEVRSRTAGLPEPLLAFNYLGQFDQGLADGRFQAAAESPGDLVDPWTPLARELEINGQVQDGQLTLNCRFSSQRYRPRTVQRLLDYVGVALERLIEQTDVRHVPSVSHEAPAMPMDSSQLNPLLQLGGSRAANGTLFCPHPVSGTVVGYYPLAGRLAADWNVWGLQNRQILDGRWRDVSLASMARDYVRALLDKQPNGPYYLLGWSMGGALVLEMATLLERLGKRVDFVGLIDGYVPGAGQARADVESSPSPEDVSEDQWQQLLALERHMRQLARDHREIRPLRAPVHVWWASQSPENNANAEALLEAAMGHPLSSSTWLDADHLGIVRDQTFMDQLQRTLSRLAVRSTPVSEVQSLK